jgi:uroporphyrinogen-III synthase
MGIPTQTAWREAGGAEPDQWLISPTGESMGLESLLRHHSSVCVLRGNQGRNDLIETLQHASVPVSTVAMYDKVQHPQFAIHLNRALSQTAVAIYLSSTDQAARLLAVARNQHKLLTSPLLVSHRRIADAAKALGFKQFTLNQMSE